MNTFFEHHVNMTEFYAEFENTIKIKEENQSQRYHF